MQNQLTLPTSPSPEIAEGDLITKILFNQQMYYQGHDKRHDDMLHIVMGVASQEVEWDCDNRRFLVETFSTAVVDQDYEGAELRTRLDTKSKPDQRNGIIIENHFPTESDIDTIVDEITLFNGKDFVYRTIIGEPIISLVQTELSKRSVAQPRADRLVHCVARALGELNSNKYQ